MPGELGEMQVPIQGAGAELRAAAVTAADDACAG